MLAVRLRDAAGDRRVDAPLLQRQDGGAWRPDDHSRPFERALQRGVPVRVVADQHDTSVAMIERNYASCIADYSDTMVRAAQIDLAPAAGDKVVPLPSRRP